MRLNPMWAVISSLNTNGSFIALARVLSIADRALCKFFISFGVHRRIAFLTLLLSGQGALLQYNPEAIKLAAGLGAILLLMHWRWCSQAVISHDVSGAARIFVADALLPPPKSGQIIFRL